MEFSEAQPFLEEHHLAVVTTVNSKGKAQSTVVSAGLMDGKMVFASRPHTSKVRNVIHSGTCVVTIIRPDTRRYITVTGPAATQAWGDGTDDDQLALLTSVYTSMGRAPKSAEEFAAQMREERRTVVSITPDRIYGAI
jgi:PPOX class probable F420-dependent enzyme